MSDAISVRFLCHGAERSGPPLYVLRLFEYWSQHPPGFDRNVVVARPGPLVDEFTRSVTTTVTRLDPGSPERLAERIAARLGSPAVGRRIVDAAVRHRCGAGEHALTVVNGATSATSALLRSLAPVGPVALIAHELSTGWFGNIDAEDRELLLARVTAYLAVSEAVRTFLVGRLGIDRAAITVVPPPVELPDASGAGRGGGARTRRAPDGPRPLIIGGGGVTDWRKAPEIWIDVAHRVIEAVPGRAVRFVWFGGARPGEAEFWPLQHEIDHLGLGTSMTFLGPIDDPGPQLDSFDVFVSTAREDANPMVCAEAAARGVPVVAFDNGGAAEMIGVAGSGIVVPYPDTDGMAAAIAGLVRDDDQRHTLGNRGAVHAAAHLGVDTVAPQVEAWIRSLVDR